MRSDCAAGLAQGMNGKCGIQENARILPIFQAGKHLLPAYRGCLTAHLEEELLERKQTMEKKV